MVLVAGVALDTGGLVLEAKKDSVLKSLHCLPLSCTFALNVSEAVSEDRGEPTAALFTYEGSST